MNRAVDRVRQSSEEGPNRQRGQSPGVALGGGDVTRSRRENGVRAVSGPRPTGLTLREVPFSILVRTAKPLVDARREYASRSAEERRMAADFQYHSAGAHDIFAATLGERARERPWPGEAVALAIDATYAPAILTMGSWEFIYGRPEEGLKLFLSLTALPAETEDLPTIIDKAGDFLLDRGAFQSAFTLYEEAARRHPEVSPYPSGQAHCAGKLGRFEDAVCLARRAVELEPENGVWLSNLGWSLVEAGRPEEAEPVLEQAVALAPPTYDLARGNLEEVRRLLRVCRRGTKASRQQRRT